MHLVTFRSEEQSEFGFDAAYELMYRILIFFSDLLIDALPSEVHVYARGKLKPTPENFISTAICPAWKEPGVMNLAAMMAITSSPIRMRKHAAALAQRRQR